MKQRPLQHISNAFLLGEGREWDYKFVNTL